MTEHAATPPRKKGNWGTRIILVLIAVAFAVITYFALASILPIWWANVIRNQVQGNLGVGILVGMFYGFVFTFVPLLVAWQATYRPVKWPLKIVIVLLAVALAAPNLLTAGILLGTSESAHNAQRILGTDATWFPMWTQISAIVAAAVFLAGLLLWRIWRRRGKKVRTLKSAEAERLKVARNATEGTTGAAEARPSPTTPEPPAQPGTNGEPRSNQG